jgi:hypothetical protein
MITKSAGTSRSRVWQLARSRLARAVIVLGSVLPLSGCTTGAASRAMSPDLVGARACRPGGDPPANATGWMVFVGRYARTSDDDAGYANRLRYYAFEPVSAWHGVSSDQEAGGVMFVPDARDSASARALPRFEPGDPVFVVVNLGGMLGRMPIIVEAVPLPEASSRIAALGAPCWTR